MPEAGSVVTEGGSDAAGADAAAALRPVSWQPCKGWTFVLLNAYAVSMEQPKARAAPEAAREISRCVDGAAKGASRPRPRDFAPCRWSSQGREMTRDRALTPDVSFGLSDGSETRDRALTPDVSTGLSDGSDSLPRPCRPKALPGYRAAAELLQRHNPSCYEAVVAGREGRHRVRTRGAFSEGCRCRPP